MLTNDIFSGNMKTLTQINENMRTRLLDIAKIAKVSCTTVSRALNNKGSINHSTKEKIMQIAQKLGYSPNRAAQILVNEKTPYSIQTKVIGIVFEEGYLNDTYFSNIIKTIEREAGINNISTFLSSFSNKYESFLSVSHKMKDALIRGLLLVGDIKDENIALFKEHFKNCVIVDKPSQIINSVVNDNRRGASDAVNHLIKTGCKNIAFISGPQEHYFSQAVFEGYKDALKENNIAYNEELFGQGSLHTESGYTAMKSILERVKTVDGLFTNDEMALGAMRAIKEKGLTIPGDISVIGFDDLYWSLQIDPKLSTVSVNYVHMAKVAIRKIIDNIDDENIVPDSVIIPVELVIRETTRRDG